MRPIVSTFRKVSTGSDQAQACDRRSWHGTNLRGSNWFRRQTDATEQEWRSDVALLNQAHRSLRDAVTTMTARDLYHAGQIQLLKKLSTEHRQ